MRARVRLEAEGGSWLVIEAWRAISGHALVYLLPLDGGAPPADDRRDRRAVLEPGRELADLDAAAREALASGGAPLTPTERRFTDKEGETWLAQCSGPVWAEGVADGLTGIVFTRLTGGHERRLLRNGRPDLTVDELRSALGRAAGAGATDAVDPEAADGEEPDG